MNIDARNAIKNSNALFLGAMIPYRALIVRMMKELSALCLRAVLKAVESIYHLLPHLHVPPFQAKIAEVFTENQLRKKQSNR